MGSSRHNKPRANGVEDHGMGAADDDFAGCEGIVRLRPALVVAFYHMFLPRQDDGEASKSRIGVMRLFEVPTVGSQASSSSPARQRSPCAESLKRRNSPSSANLARGSTYKALPRISPSANRHSAVTSKNKQNRQARRSATSPLSPQ